MASGLRGRPGRCHPYLNDMQICMHKAEDPQNECVSLCEDYLECLHGTKEMARKTQIYKEEMYQEKLAGTFDWKPLVPSLVTVLGFKKEDKTLHPRKEDH